MSTERLRRELEALKTRGLRDCRECGYPNDPDTEVKVVIRRPGDPLPEEREPEYCKVCKRQIPHTVIRMPGLPGKSKGTRQR
jgi:hypothetical protein